MLYAIVRNRKIEVKQPVQVVRNGVGVDHLKLDMDEEWSRMTSIIAVFTLTYTKMEGGPEAKKPVKHEVSKELLYTYGEELLVPWECLVETGKLTLSFTGYVGDTQIMRTALAQTYWDVIQEGVNKGEPPLEPTPSLLDQILKAVGDAEAAAAFARQVGQDLREAAIRGEFDGKDGATPTIGANGNWQIDGVDTGKPSKGRDGTDGTDGINGTDGFSPTVTVAPIPGGHTVNVTDADGTESFDVMDGTDGVDGKDGSEPAFATCYDEAAPAQAAPNIWYVPKDLPRPSAKVGMMIDVQWVHGRVDGLGYDVQLVWGAPGAAGNEVILDQTNTSDSLTGEYSIPVEGTIRYQLVEANGRKHWQYVSGPVIPRQFSTATAEAVADKVVPGMQLSYIPGQDIYVTLDHGNTAAVMRLVPDEGPTLPVYTNGRGAATGPIPAGYICHMINAGDHWILDNLGGVSQEDLEAGDAVTLAAAKAYADNQADHAAAAAIEHSDTQDTATLQAAESYADAKASEAQGAAIRHSDTQDALTLQAAKDYTDAHGGSDYDIIQSGDPDPEPPASGKGFVIVEGEEIPDPPTPGGDISLGLTGMAVGDKIEVASVDKNGVPTGWKPEEKWELIETINIEPGGVVPFNRDVNLKELIIKSEIYNPSGVLNYLILSNSKQVFTFSPSLDKNRKYSVLYVNLSKNIPDSKLSLGAASSYLRETFYGSFVDTQPIEGRITRIESKSTFANGAKIEIYGVRA